MTTVKQMEQVYKPFENRWVQVQYGKLNHVQDFGHVGSVKEGYLFLDKFYRNLSTDIFLDIQLVSPEVPVPIGLSDILRIIEVPEQTIKNLIESAEKSGEKAVKARREELQLDPKRAGFSQT